MTTATHSKLRVLLWLAIAWAPEAFGGVVTHTLKVNGPSADDLARTEVVSGVTRLAKTQQAGTNEQGDVKLFSGTTQGLYVEMRTSDLAGIPPLDRVQAACSSFQLIQGADGTVTAQKLPGESWVTSNQGNDYRNANQPYLVPLGKGAMMFTYNYQPQGQGDTKRYAKILGPSCNAIPIVDGKGTPQNQVVIMEKENDDCSMNEDGGGADTRILPSGATRVVLWAGCNGNGEDKGWLDAVDISCTNDASGNPTSCKISKQFDVALAQREERSRGRCSMSSADPDTAICTWTEGNNQPQRDGTWIAAVDVGVNGALGPSAQSRVLWKQLIENRKLIPTQGTNTYTRSYSVRAKSARVMALDANGLPTQTDLLFVSTGDLIGNNQNNKKGGRYVDHRLGLARANRSGLSWVIPMQSVMGNMVGFDYTHIKMTGVLLQNASSVIPGVTLLQGSQNGGGVHPPDLKIFGLDQVNNQFIDYGAYSVTGASYDRSLYSNYLGGNPGIQGRNFAGATFALNPFLGQNGNTSQFLVLHALTGKDPADASNAALKPSSYVTVTQLDLTSSSQQPIPVAKNGLAGGYYSPRPPSSAGCSAAPGGSSWGPVALVLLALGLRSRAARRRRALHAGAAALLLAGCAGPYSKTYLEVLLMADGGFPIGGPGPIQGASGTGTAAALTPSSARTLFDANVGPVLSASCAGSNCHSTAGATPITFVVPPPQDLYLSVLSYGDQLLSGDFDKATAQILTTIEGGHYATYTPQNVTDISNWLDAEVAAHDGGTSSQPSAARQLMSQWSGCMSLTDWNADGVAVAWATKGSSKGDCQQCHVNGQGFLATQDSARMFEILTTLANPTEPGQMFMEDYFIPDVTTNPANPIMVLNTAQIANAGSGNLPQHPLFDINDGDALNALQTFYNHTMAHLDAGACGPPMFSP